MPAARNQLDGPILFLAAAILFLSLLACPAAAVTVTVKQHAPMESLSAAGDVTGVTESKVGASYTLVRTEADQVVLQDASGRYRLPLAATDFVPPPPVALSPAPTPGAQAPSPTTNAPPQTTAPSPSAPASPLENAAVTAPPDGYNPETREIAWSDPWGRDTTERWMTMQEAQRCTLGEYYIITW